MAIVKHKISHNARYTDVLDYYVYMHRRVEDQKNGHYEQILDEDGLPILRENFAVAYLNADGDEADPYDWAAACQKTNREFQKNGKFNDIKTHEYFISHPESDREKMTMDDLLEEGKSFSKEFFEGYDVLIAVHRDTDNDHIHITLNSVRAQEREKKDWMQRDPYGEIWPKEYKAGRNHQDSPYLRRAACDWLLEYSKQHGLELEDNNAKADVKKRQREAEKKTKLPKKQREIREALLKSLPKCKSVNALSTMLKEEYGITLFLRGRTVSFQHSGSQKAVRLRTLGMTDDDFWDRLGKESVPDFDPGPAAEEKNYAQWLQERRERNAAKAEQTIRDAERVAAANIQRFSGKYSKENYRQLRYMIQKTTYVERDLETERDKLERVMERWELFLDPSAPERWKHRGYIQWCGLDPSNTTDYQSMVAALDSIRTQIDLMGTTRDALVETAARWKDRGLSDFPDLEWSVENVRSLKEQIRVSRKNLLQLNDAAWSCYKAAKRRMDDPKYLAKTDYLLKRWEEAKKREKVLKSQLKELRAQKPKANIWTCEKEPDIAR